MIFVVGGLVVLGVFVIHVLAELVARLCRYVANLLV